MTARKPPSAVTSYHSWEGDACRLHKGQDGQLTADIYRAGKARENGPRYATLTAQNAAAAVERNALKRGRG